MSRADAPVRRSLELALACLLWAAPCGVRAQTAWIEADVIGLPIALMTTPTLQAGAVYEFQTTNLVAHPSSAFADTVVSLRTSPYENAETLSGADACDVPGSAFEFERSCFRFTPSASAKYWLWVRSWLSGTAGTADLRYRCVSGCGSTSWQTLYADFSFGGVVHDAGPGAIDAVRFETTEVHGCCTGDPAQGEYAQQSILFAPDDYDYSVNWDLRPNFDPLAPYGLPMPGTGTPFSHRRTVGGTAEWLGNGDQVGLGGGSGGGAVIAGTLYPLGSGPFRLLRNDYITSTKDWDGDELGAALEQLLLTCDSTASPDRNGLACADRPGCSASAYDEALCRASLRDSDGDGLRDDVEAYGVDLWSGEGKEVGNLARYGADPAHYDVFVEIDLLDPDGEEPCVPGTPQLTEAERRDAAAVFRDMPESSLRNPDGSSGVHLHFDVGEETAGEPDVFGDWGGSGCVLEDDFETAMTPERNWLFRWAMRYPGTLGKTSVLSTATRFTSAATLVHELGHQGGLDHDGPRWLCDRVNGKPHYWSRMAYQYQNVGGSDLSGPDRDDVAFSSGLFRDYPLIPRAVSEVCSLGPTSLSDLAVLDVHSVRQRGRVFDTPVSGCMAVDWDWDGVVTPGLTQGALLSGGTRIARHTDRSGGDPGVRFHSTVAGGELVIHDDAALLWVKVVPTASGNVLRVLENDAMPCYAAPVGPLGTEQFPPCWSLDRQWDAERAPGAPLRPTAVTAAAATVAGAPAVVVAYVEAGSVRWATIERPPAGGALALTDRGAVPGSTAVPSSPELHAPSLRPFGSSGLLLLVYNDALGAVREHTLDPTTGAWAGGGAATESGSGALLVPETGSAGLATVLSAAYGDGVVMLLPERDAPADPLQVRVLRRLAGTSAWDPLGALPAPVSGTGARGRPSLVEIPDGVGYRLVAYWTASGSALEEWREYFSETGRGSLTWQAPERVWQVQGAVASSPPVAVFDDRPTAATPGVRVAVSHARTFASAADCACAPPTSVCAQIASGLWTCSDAVQAARDGYEFLAPFGDGRAGITLRDADDHPQLRWGLCYAIRQPHLEAQAPASFRDGPGPCGAEPIPAE